MTTVITGRLGPPRAARFVLKSTVIDVCVCENVCDVTEGRDAAGRLSAPMVDPSARMSNAGGQIPRGSVVQRDTSAGMETLQKKKDSRRKFSGAFRDSWWETRDGGTVRAY